MAYSSQSKLEDRLNRLLRSSLAGEIDWVVDDESSTRYRYVTPGGDIVIDSRDEDDAAPYDLLIYEQDGRFISGIHWSTDMTAVRTITDEKLARLYEAAKDKGSGVSEKLDRIIERLPPLPDNDTPL